MKWKGRDEEEKKDSSSVDGTSMTKSKTNHHYVYVRSDDHGWVPARFLRMHDEYDHEKEAVVIVDRYDEDEQAMLSCLGNNHGDNEADIYAVNLRGYPGGVLPLQNTDEHGELMEYPDMVDLPFLHEAAIMYNLKLRHMLGKPYTRTGDIVIAVNPYQWFDLYKPEQQSYYAHKLLWNDLDSGHKHAPKDLPPHVYETSTLAYKGMALGGKPQSILVSGESGAGKTETCKLLQHHIANLQQGPLASPGKLDNNQVVKRVLDSNSLLEAFGNAETRRNDNSSRFGKYTQLQFARQSIHQVSSQPLSPATLVGSTCEVYLLEKSRVVHDATNERNFHIFYELLAAPAQEQARIWGGLVGKIPESFSYLGSTPTSCVEGISDHDRFFKTVKTLEFVGISGTLLIDLFRSLCIVLQLGNLAFVPDPTDDDKTVISSEHELQELADLMGLSGGAEALRRALTERTMKTNKEVYKVPLTAAVAKDSCDALAKDIYEKVFLWLVWMINVATCAGQNYENNDTIATSNSLKMIGDSYGSIGLLDIFGFEAYQVNGFEQLCINYANEKLQYRFTEDCFRLVEEEYKQEGIAVEPFFYDDNTDVLDLIEGRTGLLAMLNEECWRPRGSSADFVNKALYQNGDSPCLIANAMDRLSFGIHHYAGKVLYDANGFVRLNQDRLASDLKECATKTTNSIISGEYAMAMMEETGTDGPESAGRRSVNSNLMAKTVWTKYKTQLTILMTSLQSTESRYIRCIKPNNLKSPLILDHTLTINQLRSCGVVSSVTITRSAFPNRLPNDTVLSRFGDIRSLGRESGSETQLKDDAEALLSFALKSKRFTDPSSGAFLPAFVVGKTKTFFREGALEYLETERMNGLGWQAAIVIQRRWRSFLKHKGVVLATRFQCRRKEDINQSMALEWRARNAAKKKAKQQLAAKRVEEFGKTVATQRREPDASCKVDKKDKSLKSTKEVGKTMATQRQKFDAKMGKKDKSLRQLRQVETGAEKQEPASTTPPANDKPIEVKKAKTISSPANDKPVEVNVEVSVKTKKRQKKELPAWRSPKKEEVKAPASPVDDELAKLQAEIASLKMRKQLQDREADGKVKAANDRQETARAEVRKLKRLLEDHADNAWREERSVKREIAQCKGILGEREKLIAHLELEQERLGNVLKRTQRKWSAMEEKNKKLKGEASAMEEKNKKLNKDKGAIIKTIKRQSIKLKDELQQAYKSVKSENEDLHERVTKQQEQFCLMAQAKLELQNALAKILEIVQSECKDRDLRDQVVRVNLQTSKEAYKQMKVVQKLQKEAKRNVRDHSVSDLHQSWIVH